MTIAQQIITIGLCAVGTMLTRFLPFAIFSEKNRLLNTSDISETPFPERYSECWWFIALKELISRPKVMGFPSFCRWD